MNTELSEFSFDFEDNTLYARSHDKMMWKDARMNGSKLKSMVGNLIWRSVATIILGLARPTGQNGRKFVAPNSTHWCLNIYQEQGGPKKSYKSAHDEFGRFVSTFLNA